MILLSLLFSSSVFAASSCDYYLEKEKETRCYIKKESSSDYLLNFGYRLCHKYFQKAADWQDERSIFVDKVATCLQREYERLSQDVDCKKMEQRFLDLHPYCYGASGYCELSPKQKTSILWIALEGDALQKEKNPLVKALQLLKECKGNSTTATVENSLAESK
jgi:hypothetical protein